MLWLMIVLLSIISLFPCILVLYSKKTFFPSQNPALPIYQAQLRELEREIRNNLILPESYQQAKLEIQHRILDSDSIKAKNAFTTYATSRSGLFFICCGLVCIPLTAIGLYLINGMPVLPAQPLQARLMEQNDQNQKLAPYLQQLKDRISTLPADDPRWFEGNILLGKIEADQGHLDQALQAWQAALHQHYDSTLAAQIAEIMIQKNGYVTQEAYTLFNQALKSAPADAPWKELVEQRIIEYQKSHP